MHPEAATTDIIAELRGTRCRCGKVKKPMETFCKNCYWSLPPHLRGGLYRHIGDGYVEAYVSAIVYLWGIGVERAYVGPEST